MPLPGPFGVPSSRFRNIDGLPALPDRTEVLIAARAPPVGALYELSSGTDLAGVWGEIAALWAPRSVAPTDIVLVVSSYALPVVMTSKAIVGFWMARVVVSPESTSAISATMPRAKTPGAMSARYDICPLPSGVSYCATTRGPLRVAR